MLDLVVTKYLRLHPCVKFFNILVLNIYLYIFRDNYGFVTYYDTKDAFTAIENGGKLRRPNELPFDLCFGGRRQFCKATYSDLGKLLVNVEVVTSVKL